MSVIFSELLRFYYRYNIFCWSLRYKQQIWRLSFRNPTLFRAIDLKLFFILIFFFLGWKKMSLALKFHIEWKLAFYNISTSLSVLQPQARKVKYFRPPYFSNRSQELHLYSHKKNHKTLNKSWVTDKMFGRTSCTGKPIFKIVEFFATKIVFPHYFFLTRKQKLYDQVTKFHRKSYMA